MGLLALDFLHEERERVGIIYPQVK